MLIMICPNFSHPSAKQCGTVAKDVALGTGIAYVGEILNPDLGLVLGAFPVTEGAYYGAFCGQ
jgi:hypothetical protein